MDKNVATGNLADISAFLAREWYHDQVRDIYGAYYLWIKPCLPGETTWHPIVSKESPGDRWELADPQRISPGYSTEYVTKRIYDILRRSKILPVDR